MIDTDLSTFDRFWAFGYERLVPIIPPSAEISTHSTLYKRVGTKQDGRGKTPGTKGRDGKWSSFDWAQYEADRDDLRRWHGMNAGVGIKTGNGLVAIDADTLDKDHAKTILDEIDAKFGRLPVRIGNHPKAIYLCRVDGPLPYMRVEFGDERVELLTEGRQFVASGVHPKTGQPYSWPREIVPYDDLPIFKPEDFVQLLEALRHKLPASSRVIKEGSGKDVDQGVLKGDLATVRKAVNSTPNTSAHFPTRETYLGFGYAIKAALPDDPDEAFELFSDWCSRWDGGENDPGIVDSDWRRMKGPYKRGASWLYEQAERHGTFDRAEAWFTAIEPSDNPFTEIELNALKGDGVGSTDGVYPVVDVNALMTREPPKMLVARHIPEQSIGFVYGEPGSFKSFLTLDIGLHIAAGQPEWHGDRLDVDPESVVVYLAFEGAFGMRNRIRAWCKQHEVEPADLAKRFKMIEVSVNFMEPKDIAKLIRTVRQAIGARPCLIVADTVSRALPGADENLQKDMTLFVHACDALRQAFGCAVVGVHHAGKSGDMRGSTVLRGAGDYVFRMTRREKSSLVALECEKQKDAPDGWSDTYATASIELEGGESSLALERMEAGLGVGPDVELTPAVTTKVLEAMEAAWVSGEPWTATYHGRDRHAVQQMCRGFGFNAVDAEAALRGWIASGIVAEDLVDRKKKRKGLKVVGRVQAAETAVWNSDIYG